MVRLFFVLLLATVALQVRSQSLPEGFHFETITDDVAYPVGMVHTGSADSYVWTQDGKVYIIRDGEVDTQPLIDLSDEVGFWSDHGMLGLALHPDFESNGWMYLMYVVDRYHLFHAEDSNYDPTRNAYNQATIARITRYTLTGDQVVEGSRQIIIGKGPQDGIPITTKSHGIGTLLFGRDTSLLFSVGDGSAPGKDFVGQPPIPELAFDQQALEDGILTEAENVGAYRAQFLNTYCGKILRVDPETGEGLDANPFYDPARPDDPISKVWALGFRNPFRMTLYPGSTRADNPGPGDLLVGDVGDWSWEEINIVDGPGLNFGWPVYQGQESYYLFRDKEVPNLEAPISLGNCDQNYFSFKDLIAQPTADHGARFDHPCGAGIPFPDFIPAFVHQRPVLAYANWISEKRSATTPGFALDGRATSIGVKDPRSPITYGEDFNGSSSIAGVFYTLEGYPDSLHHAYFHGDFQGSLRVLTFNENREVRTIEQWSDAIGGVVHISENPYDNSVYVVTHDPHRIVRLSFEGNRKPVIVSTPDTTYGPAPLRVSFDASPSYDPDGDEIHFRWVMEGDTLSTDAVTEFTFSDVEPRTYRITLLVTDNAGQASRKDVVVSVNNTPPDVEITSIKPGDLYSLIQSTAWPLEAEISDQEHSVENLKYEWTVFLHHNTHFHQEAQYETRSATAHIEPLGCGIETYHYRIRLSVEDPLGLRTVREKLLYPNCGEVKPDFRIFPNPARGFITLEAVAMDVGEVKIFLHDQAGRLHYKTDRVIREGESIQLEVSDLPGGLYILQIFGDHFNVQKKVFVNL